MLPYLTREDDSDKYQFGFKAGHSTTHCTNKLKNIVNHYVDSGSPMFTYFVDFSKAFDTINYWKLFNCLIDDYVSVNILLQLVFWYSHQHVVLDSKIPFLLIFL